MFILISLVFKKLRTRGEDEITTTQQLGEEAPVETSVVVEVIGDIKFTTTTERCDDGHMEIFEEIILSELVSQQE